MNNKETAEHMRLFMEEPRMPFSWPTDGCGYEQHIKFVQHRNENWKGGDWGQFVLDYAAQLETVREGE